MMFIIHEFDSIALGGMGAIVAIIIFYYITIHDSIEQLLLNVVCIYIERKRVHATRMRSTTPRFT